MDKYKHLTQDMLEKIRKDIMRKESIIFRRIKANDKSAEQELRSLVETEKKLEQAAHKNNLYWY